MSKASRIDGKEFAAGLRRRITRQTATLKSAHDITPGLAAVLVGSDPASTVYVRNKNRQTLEVGMNSFGQSLPEETPQKELLRIISDLNADPEVHGILVQLPLPQHIDPDAVIQAIDPAKDVDGFHPLNAGALASGRSGMVPCTPLGCMMLIRDRIDDLSGLNAVIVGRSNIVGKPMALMLLAAHCTVTVAHSRTRNLPEICRRADILVAATGQPEMIKGDWIRPGATVIDVGINRVQADKGNSRLVGDVEFETARKVAGAITPVPGGVGPMTIACLLRNTLIAACRQSDVQPPEI